MSQVVRRLLFRNRRRPTEDELRIIQEFLKRWPDQEDNLRSFQKKPFCECRFDIIRAMVETPEVLTEFLPFIDPEGKLDPDLDHIPSKPSDRAKNELRGRVFEIPDTEEEYRNLLSRVSHDGFRFNGLAVSHVDAEHIRVYFY